MHATSFFPALERSTVITMHLTNADGQRIQLRHDRIYHFRKTDCSGRASMVAALVEKPFQKRGDNLFLQSVPIDFPWTGTGKNGNASQAAAQRQVHGQAIARNQTAVTLHIGQMGPAVHEMATSP